MIQPWKIGGSHLSMVNGNIKPWKMEINQDFDAFFSMFFSHGFGGRILLWKWHGCKSSSWNEKMICECIYKKRRVFQCHTTLACTKNEERPKIAPVGVNQCRKPMVVISITHVHPLQIVDKYDWEMSTSTEAASPVASSRAGATTRRIHLNSSVRNSHHPVILQAKEILDLRTSWLECLNHSRLGYEGIDMFWVTKQNEQDEQGTQAISNPCVFRVHLSLLRCYQR